MKKMLTKFDVFEIIDRAMDTKDRYISIYMSTDGNCSVSVYPLTEDETEFASALKDEALATAKEAVSNGI